MRTVIAVLQEASVRSTTVLLLVDVHDAVHVMRGKADALELKRSLESVAAGPGTSLQTSIVVACWSSMSGRSDGPCEFLVRSSATYASLCPADNVVSLSSDGPSDVRSCIAGNVVWPAPEQVWAVRARCHVPTGTVHRACATRRRVASYVVDPD